MKLYKTKGIVLRTVKYGDTSMIVGIFTELLGMQSYLVNGVRSSSAKGPGKANLFQPAAILDLVVYHNELKNLQRIKEFGWHKIYQHLFFDVIKNAVALFMVELLQKCLKQPEPHPDLFYFTEDAFLHLDQAGATVTANYPLFFALHLADFFGFRLSDEFSKETPFLDLQQGLFVNQEPDHPYFLEEAKGAITSQLLKVRMPAELEQIQLGRETRRILLQAYQSYEGLPVPEFGTLKTRPVLQMIVE